MGILETYDYVINDLGDPRTKDKFIVNTPFPSLVAILLYLYIVRVWGPRFMKDRPPYNIDWLVSIYNCIQVVWNAIYVWECIKAIYIGSNIPGFDWFCIPLFLPNEEMENMFLSGGLVYFYNKFFDFSDTFFFILRKKFNQVSHLHLYHHVIMIIGSWVVLKFHAGGNTFSLVLLNLTVHVVMYIYYQLTLMKWDTRSWKKHITQMQIAQFSLIMLHHSVLFFRNPCKNKLFIAAMVCTQGTYMLYLFITFYIKEYIVKERKQKKK